MKIFTENRTRMADKKTDLPTIRSMHEVEKNDSEIYARHPIATGIVVLALSVLPGVHAAPFTGGAPNPSVPHQPAPHTVTVNADGTFSPQHLLINSGERVDWIFAEHTDSIIPISTKNLAGALSTKSTCEKTKKYDPVVEVDGVVESGDINEFTGPMPTAAAGLFILGSNDLQERGHYTLQCTTWNENLTYPFPYVCPVDQTRTNPDFTGVFIRPSWDDINPAPGVFEWAAVDEAIEDAVSRGKLYSIGVKAGSHSPAWIFDTDESAAGEAAANPVFLLGAKSSPKTGSCGTEMKLGSPADDNYWELYAGVLTELARRIKANNKWYRSLAYVKPSGMNLHTHENRLPKRCWSPTGSGLTNEECDCVLNDPDRPCMCNPQRWVSEGNYSPAALYEFYSKQFEHIAKEFPGKTMSYAHIQAGFPIVNDYGEFPSQDVVMSDGSYLEVPNPALAPSMPMPGNTEQTENVIKLGLQDHGLLFAVQHNALDNSGQVNHIVQEVSAAGQITGFQTVNNIIDAAAMGATLQRAIDTNSVFVEIYESAYQKFKANMSTSFSEWDESLRSLRSDASQPPGWQELGEPQPLSHSHTFTHISSTAATQNPMSSDPNYLEYVHGWKCDESNPWTNTGSITILP